MAPITPAQAKHLAYSNLLSVFAERDSEKRQSAIKETYSPTITVYEANPNSTVLLTSHTQISDTVQKLLSGDDNKDWDFIPLSPVRLNDRFIFLQWGFGPRTRGEFGGGDVEGVEVKNTGSDHILVGEDGKIEKLWVVIDGLSDVRE